ncbi:heme-degrading domain-containing protein [Paenibacillus glycinis]|uniref:Heme-degrading domain-containing protein n=1 Tax=Paenibacillus glycinis TaxID=2697035 RepID=A0ABW9XRD7_9BACL|nr:heme-degrading domain-containing protein [Paenibacillus glycinis]NBD25217.1 heme-degrading domain-containing protein [Paenibacillus glycinis]
MSEFLKALLSQEEELQFESFTNEDAFELGRIIVEHARAVIGRGIAVHIENGEYPLFTHYMTGTSKDNVYWINAKKNVVHHYGHSSLYVGEKYKAEGTTFKDASGLSLEEYQGEGGSFPILVRGKGKVGTVTVSGLAGEEDHQVAVDGIRKFLDAKE